MDKPKTIIMTRAEAIEELAGWEADIVANNRPLEWIRRVLVEGLGVVPYGRRSNAQLERELNDRKSADSNETIKVRGR